MKKPQQGQRGLQRVAFDPTRPFRVLSLGGGVDSYGMKLGSKLWGPNPDLVIFADVADPAGLDPGEWDSTYQHIAEEVMPDCEEDRIEFKWLHTDESPIRGQRSLFGYCEHKSIIPSIRNRMCTSAAKVERIQAFVEEHVPAGIPIEMWVGFDAAEEKRISNANEPHARSRGRITKRFPLVEWGLCRCRCVELIQAMGKQVPNGSACVFCPHSKKDDFLRLRTERPALYRKVQELEANCQITKAGKQLRLVSYRKGDGTDRTLDEYLDAPGRGGRPYKRQDKPCATCGRIRVHKRTSCNYLE